MTPDSETNYTVSDDDFYFKCRNEKSKVEREVISKLKRSNHVDDPIVEKQNWESLNKGGYSRTGRRNSY